MEDKPEEPAPNKKAPSQGFLDAQRAMGLRHAAKRGWKTKDGLDIAADNPDRVWFEGYEKSRPAKPDKPAKVDTAPAAKAPRLRVAPIVETPEVFPDPPPNEPAPKVDIGTRAKPASGGKGSKWAAKYKSDLDMTVKVGDKEIKVNLADESGRELVCISLASFIAGAYDWLAGSLELVGKKPLVPTQMIFAAAVVSLDKRLPTNINPEPEHILAAGFAIAGTQYALSYKKIAEAKKQKGARDEHDRAREKLREQTRKAEAEYHQAESTKAVEKEHAAQPPTAPVTKPVTDTTEGDSRDRGPLTLDPSPRVERPVGWNINAPVELPDGAVF